jgi:hypothetical protein
VVTHLTTNPPVRCLNRAERTGSLVFNVLWSYVEEHCNHVVNNFITADSILEGRTPCCLLRESPGNTLQRCLPHVAFRSMGTT